MKFSYSFIAGTFFIINLLCGCGPGSPLMSSEEEVFDTYLYRGFIHVIHKNGDPCSTAYAQFNSEIVHADSSGLIILSVEKEYPRGGSHPPTGLVYSCVVFEYPSHIIWEGEITLLYFCTFQCDNEVEIVI